MLETQCSLSKYVTSCTTSNPPNFVLNIVIMIMSSFSSLLYFQFAIYFRSWCCLICVKPHQKCYEPIIIWCAWGGSLYLCACLLKISIQKSQLIPTVMFLFDCRHLHREKTPYLFSSNWKGQGSIQLVFAYLLTMTNQSRMSFAEICYFLIIGVKIFILYN